MGECHLSMLMAKIEGGSASGTYEIGVNEKTPNKKLMQRNEEVSKEIDKGNAGLVDVNRPVVPQPRGNVYILETGEVDAGGVDKGINGQDINLQGDNDREEFGRIETCKSREDMNMPLEDDRLEICVQGSDGSSEENDQRSDFLDSSLISKRFENDVRQAISEVDAEQRRGNDRLEKVLESLENKIIKEKEETTQMLQSVCEMYEDTPRRSQRLAKKELLKKRGN